MKFVTTLIFFILNFLLDDVKACLKCPSFAQTANFKNAEELDNVQDHIFENLWNAEEPKLTCSAEELKKIIFHLKESGNSLQENYAMAVSEFIWSYIPQLSRNPDLFPYTNIIRANAEFIKHGKCKCPEILHALDFIKPAVIEAISLALDTGVKNAGCQYSNFVNKNNKTNKSPFNYNNSNIWDNDEDLFPLDWQEKVKELGHSKNKIDKTIALLAYAFISNSMMVLEKSINPVFKYQVYAMSSTEKIPKKCCAEFVHEVNVLKSVSEDMIDLAIQDAKISTRCIKKKCEDYRNIANFSNPEEITKLQNDLFDKLWKTNFPPISSLARKLQTVLMYMVMDSNVPFWQIYAISATDWIWVHLPSIHSIPHYCSYAQTINATVKFSENKDCPMLLKGINATINAFTEAGHFATENGINNSGCESKPITISNTSCYRNGFAYDFHGIWDLEGWKYPCALKIIVSKLYNSNNYVDRVMALFASAVLSNYMTNMLSEYSPEPVLRTFVMFNKGKIDENCCPDFIREARELLGSVQVMNLRTFRTAVEGTGCLQKC